jgi:isopenicillin N synthase-like dioxygenase
MSSAAIRVVHRDTLLIDLDLELDPAEHCRRLRRLLQACREQQPFLLRRREVAPAALAQIDDEAARFFALPDAIKEPIAIERSARAWRGWRARGLPRRDGDADGSEGLYFGEEHHHRDPRVRRGVPLHGANQYLADQAALSRAVVGLVAASKRAGDELMSWLALAQGLPENHYEWTLTQRPGARVRVLHYPADAREDGRTAPDSADLGLFTLVAPVAGAQLEIVRGGVWGELEVPAGTLLCKPGEALARVLHLPWRPHPHRFLAGHGEGINSVALSFDPDLEAPVDGAALRREGKRHVQRLRWTEEAIDPQVLPSTWGGLLWRRLGGSAEGGHRGDA